MYRKLKAAIFNRLAGFLQAVLDHSHGWPLLMKRVEKLAEKLADESRRHRDAVKKLSSENRQLQDSLAAAKSQLSDASQAADVSAKRSECARITASRFGSSPAGAARSVIFVEQSYYHHYYLARALRDRGWDARLAAFHDPAAKWTKYFHGQDVHLWSPDHESLKMMREAFFDIALGRFQMAHFAGDGLLSFLDPDYTSSRRPDLEEWRGHGKFIGFTIGGCNTGVSKESVAEWSLLGGRKVCDRCVFNDNPDVCSPAKTLGFGKMLLEHCSLICGEVVPRLDLLDDPRTIFEPLTMCLDEHFWSPDLKAPDRFRIDNPAGDILIYHGMGETEARSAGKINIKGTQAISQAVERLRQEGHAVRFVFATGMSNRDVRFMQAQADIVVDQLNYGRYGAQAREGMMLGKPVICLINKQELNGPPLDLWDECPLVSASEETVYEEIKRLVLDERARKELGREGRSYAIKWHSPAQCARRYEMVYDELMKGVTDFTSLTRSKAWREPAAA